MKTLVNLRFAIAMFATAFLLLIVGSATANATTIDNTASVCNEPDTSKYYFGKEICLEDAYISEAYIGKDVFGNEGIHLYVENVYNPAYGNYIVVNYTCDDANKRMEFVKDNLIYKNVEHWYFKEVDTNKFVLFYK